MSRLAGLRHSLRTLLRPGRVSEEAADEMAFHLERQTRKHMAQGMSEAQAIALARREFGGTSRFQQETADARRWRTLESVWQDARHGVRSLRKHAGFTIVALLTLSIGMGAATVAWTTVDHLLLRPLPYRDAERLVALTEANDERATAFPFSIPNMRDVQSLTHSFSAIGAALGTQGTLDTGPETDGVIMEGGSVTGNYFDILGVAPARGRWITAEDQSTSAPLVVVLSHAIWAEQLGSDPAIIGRTIRLSGTARTVIGIAPPEFGYPAGAAYWVPCRFCPTAPESSRPNISASVVARLAPGVSVEAARVDINHAASIIHRDHPDPMSNQMTSAHVELLKDAVLGDTTHLVMLLSGSIACVLLIGCANLANANLARNTVRLHELTLRSALGASRRRVMQLLLLESLTLSFGGGLLGLLGAAWGVKLVTREAGAFLPRLGELQLDARAVLFALIAAVVVASLIGLLPALRLSAGELQLRFGERGQSGRSQALVRRALIALEMALAVVLLVGAGLSIRSLRLVLREPTGIDPRGVISFQPVTGRRLNSDTLVGQYFDELLGSFRQIPGVTGATAASAPPLGNQWTGFIDVEGQQGRNPTKDVAAAAGYNMVTEGYFETVGLTLLKGRLFTNADDASHPHVTVINKTMAALYWPGENPLGKRFRALSMDSHANEWLTVIGVVSDLHYYSLEQEVTPIHYVSSRQRPDRLASSTVIVRSALPAATMVPRIRQALRSLDPTATAHVTTLDRRIEETTRTRRLMVALLSTFAGAALLLAAIGIYGVLSYIVVQRTREIGVRMALGSTVGGVIRLMLGDIMRPVVFGLIVGLLMARLLTRVLQGLVYQLSPMDPLVLTGTCALLVLLSMLAAIIPARRVALVDPLIALRGD